MYVKGVAMCGFSLTAVVCLFATAAHLWAQTAPPSPDTLRPQVPTPGPDGRILPSAATNRWALLINAARLPAAEFEEIRAYMEKDLWIRIEGIALSEPWSALPDRMPSLFTTNRVIVVTLAEGPLSGPYLLVAPDDQWAIANTTRFLAGTTNRTLRLRQAAMRALACALGVPICQDPHCVMRILRRGPDPFLQMGSNFCGPTRRVYQSLAVQRGLIPVPPGFLRQHQPPAPPSRESQ
jgi:hypothetical protein